MEETGITQRTIGLTSTKTKNEKWDEKLNYHLKDMKQIFLAHFNPYFLQNENNNFDFLNFDF